MKTGPVAVHQDHRGGEVESTSGQYSIRGSTVERLAGHQPCRIVVVTWTRNKRCSALMGVVIRLQRMNTIIIGVVIRDIQARPLALRVTVPFGRTMRPKTVKQAIHVMLRMATQPCNDSDSGLSSVVCYRYLVYVELDQRTVSLIKWVLPMLTAMKPNWLWGGITGDSMTTVCLLRNWLTITRPQVTTRTRQPHLEDVVITLIDLVN